MSLNLTTERGQKVDRDLSSRVESATLSMQAGSIVEMTLTWTATSLLDAAFPLVNGDLVQVAGRKYQVGRRERALLPDGSVQVSLKCRSILGRQLRQEYIVRATGNVSPDAWVTAAVTRAGGRVLTQKSTTRETITQRGGKERSSTLKVIDSLASTLGWTWAEADGLVTFASGYAILMGTVPGARTTRVALRDAEQFTSWDSDDSAEAQAGATIVLPDTFDVDPLTVVDVADNGIGPDAGRWLVESTSQDLMTSAGVQVTLTRPRRPVARRRTTKKATAKAA